MVSFQFKDIPKLGGVDSPFYRQGLGVPGYPGYSPGLMGHPGLTTGPTPFVPPNHLPTFQPKVSFFLVWFVNWLTTDRMINVLISTVTK